jgi:hypothetical protein
MTSHHPTYPHPHSALSSLQSTTSLLPRPASSSTSSRNESSTTNRKRKAEDKDDSSDDDEDSENETNNNNNNNDDKKNHLNVSNNPNNPNNPNKKGKGGSSCHQCKSRRNFTALTYCTSNLDKKNKRCRKKFCGHCLKKFYKENPSHIADRNNWKCPSCRKICCCAACRRRKGKDSVSGRDDFSSTNTNGSTTTNTNGSTNPLEPPIKGKRARLSAAAAAAAANNSALPLDNSSSSSALNSSSGSSLSSHTTSLPSSIYSLYHNDDNNTLAPMSDDPSYSAMFSATNGHPNPTDPDYMNPFMPYSPLQLPEELQLQALRDLDDADIGDNSSGNESGDDSLSSQSTFSSSQFTTVLAAHIRAMAEEAKNNQNSAFARIWKGCQEGSVRKKIRTILHRQDTKKDKKVDMLAALLVHLQ